MKKTYFSLFQEKDYLETGLNSETKKQAIEAGLDLMLDYSMLSKKEIKAILSLNLEEQEQYLKFAYNIVVDEHEEKQFAYFLD